MPMYYVVCLSLSKILRFLWLAGYNDLIHYLHRKDGITILDGCLLFVSHIIVPPICDETQSKFSLIKFTSIN